MKQKQIPHKTQHTLFKVFLLYLICFAGSVSAQSRYITDADYIQARQEKSGSLAPFESVFNDTSVHLNHRFIPRNYLGNLNLSSPDYLLQFRTAQPGFRLYDVPLRDYIISEDDVTYFKTKGPYARLTGIAGSQQLQLFQMVFANSFKNNFNISLKLNRYTSQGFYKQQQGSTNNFYVSAHYHTPNNRFGFNSYVLVNNNKFQENGGISGDTIAGENLLAAKNIFPVKINKAARENRELKANYNNWFKLNKSNDKPVNIYLNAYSRFTMQKFRYKDDNSGTDNFYLLYYLDTLSTNDSTRLFQLHNGGNVSVQNKQKTIAFSGGYENEINSLWQKYDTTFTNHLLKTNLLVNHTFQLKDSSLQLQFRNNLSFKYILSGNQAGDYLIESHHRLNLLKEKKTKLFAELRLMNENRTPDYLFRKWYSNHFIWENKFNTTQILMGDVTVGNKLFQLGGAVRLINNYIYLDQNAYPMQLNEQVGNAAFKVQASHVFFKHLGLNLKYTFQSAGTPYISMPDHMGQASLFYTGNLFRNNLNLSIGGDIEYFSEFTPYGYMPATQQFYVQEKFRAGGFPFVDFFINGRIKPVNFFLKIENILHGIAGTNYSLVPGYFQPDRAFRFGLTWTFFD